MVEPEGSKKENQVSRVIVEAAIEVHKTLGGPGLLESVYEEALAFELVQRGCPIERQKVIFLVYKGQQLSTPLRLDLLAGGCVIVECKATVEYNSIYEAQLRTYLKLSGLKLGLVINFGERYVKDGIHRVVNGL
jgi:GxxExxY protein